ncbi:hypothetical protein [Streptomyces sp. NPDC002078]
MPEHPWFVIEPEDDEEFEFTDDERAFAAALRERTAGWASAGVGGELARTDAWDSLVAHLSFSDPGGRLHLLYAGVHFTGDRVRGDRLHDQLFTPTGTPTRHGSPSPTTTGRSAGCTARIWRRRGRRRS